MTAVSATTVYAAAERWVARWGDPGKPYNTNHTVATGCFCWINALEPDEGCPQHSGGEWPPRCQWCGKFMRWEMGDKEAGNE